MREIKFRALGQTDRKWHYGLLSFFQNEVAKIFENVYHTWICDAGTLGQFTGLHDKNGVEVYEGDIIHLYGEDRVNKYDWKAVVAFGNPNGLYSWGYQLKPIAEFRYNVDILAWIEMEECGIYAEVIGNIHEKEN